MADHLEAAAEALIEAVGDDWRLVEFTDAWRDLSAEQQLQHASSWLVPVFSSLLGDLPEEAVREATRQHSTEQDPVALAALFVTHKNVIYEFLQSLRDSLVSGRGETNDG